MNTDSLFSFLLELLVKSVAILAMAALVVRIWRGATASQRHFVWLAAMLIVLALPTMRGISPRWNVHWAQKSATMTVPALPVISPLMSEVELATEEGPRESAASSWSLPDWRLVLVGCWVAGSLGLIAYRFLGSWRLRGIERNSVPLTEARLLDEARAVFWELAIHKPVSVRLSEECRVPMTWGFRRSIILLPHEALNWSNNKVRTALLHEAGHIRRRDYWTRWMAHIACALYWPNPLVWRAARAMRETQEQATDDLVLQAGAPAGEYAAQLVDAARLVAARGLFASHAVAMASPSTLENRVLAIVDGLRDRRPMGLCTSILGSAIATLAFAFCAVVQLRAADPAAPPVGEASDPAPALATETKTPPPAPQTSPIAGDAKSVATPLEDRAMAIVIPRVEMREATLRDIVSFLRKKALDLDPEKRGVNIVLKTPNPDDLKVTMSMQDIPLLEVMRYVAALSNLHLRIDPYALVLEATEENPGGGPKPVGPPAAPVKDGARAEVAPWGVPVPGKPGYVRSPFAIERQDIDVRGFKTGEEVNCPYTNRLFRVPEAASKGDSDDKSVLGKPGLMQPGAQDPLIRGRAGIEIRQANPALDRGPISRRPGQN